MSEQESAIGRVYAQSMLGLAEARGEAESLFEELRQLVVLIDREPELDAFLANPLIDQENRRAALERLLRGRASDLLVDALQVASRKQRLGMVRAIAAAYGRELQELRGQVEVQVRTAVPLSAELRERLRRAAARYTGREVLLEERVDPELIGGLVMTVGDRKLDSSIAGELRKLHRQLMERASEEIHGGHDYFVE